MDNQGRTGNAFQIEAAAGFAIVVVTTAKTMQGGGNVMVEGFKGFQVAIRGELLQRSGPIVPALLLKKQ